MIPNPPGIGWQADGSYVPCPQCHWVPAPTSRREQEMPGRALHFVPGVPGVPGSATHEGNCPVVDLSPEAKERLRAKFEEFAAASRRAWESARNYVIG